MGINSIKAYFKGLTPSEKIDVVFHIILGGLAFGGVIYCRHTLNKSEELLAKAVSNVASGIGDVTISDELIDLAIEKKVGDQVEREVSRAMALCARDIRSTTKEKVEEAVKDTRHQITESVTNRISEECRKIYEDDLKKEIRDKAAEKLSEKLDSAIDTVTDDYAKNLNNMSKIYEALAEKINKKEM